jgi:hypothetical protein
MVAWFGSGPRLEETYQPLANGWQMPIGFSWFWL